MRHDRFVVFDCTYLAFVACQRREGATVWQLLPVNSPEKSVSISSSDGVKLFATHLAIISCDQKAFIYLGL